MKFPRHYHDTIIIVITLYKAALL